MKLRLFMTSDAIGGVWRYSATLSRRLAARGASVSLGIVGPPPSREQGAELRGAGVELVRLDAPLDWLAGGYTAIASGRQAIAAAAADWGAHLIQVNQPAYAAAERGAPVIAVAHSCVETWWRATHGTGVPEEWSWHREAVGEGLASAATVVAPSAGFAQALRDAYDPRLSIEIVHNGLPEADRAVRKEPFLLAAGRAWDESKNFSMLDRAAASIAWPIRLAGDPVSPDGASRASFPGLVVRGRLDPPAMQRELARAAIFVSPSIYEPFGLGVLEAAQSGAALLLSDIATFRELWEGAALFFDPRDAEALAAQANALIADPLLRSRYGTAARLRAGGFGVDRAAAGMERLYREAVRLETGLEASH